MENTAQKLTSAQVLQGIKESHGNLDLLRVFLITGATDISKSYELVKSWSKAPMISSVDKANFDNALKTLQAIELKRVELTSIIYGIDINIQKEEEGGKTILMLPPLDETLDKVRDMFKDCLDVNKTKDMAFMELKATVGEGKVMNSEKAIVTWDDNHINQFIETVIGSSENLKKEKSSIVIGFKTVYNNIADMIKTGWGEPQIKTSLKTLLIDNIVANSETDQFLIKGEKGFEDYYNRILCILILTSITDRDKKLAEGDKETKAAEQIKTEVIPALKELDKDTTQSSFAGVTKMLKRIYESLGFRDKSLGDSLAKVQELATEVAPNLLNRYKGSKKNNIPTNVTKLEGGIEIYDDTHNIKESNKVLYAEVENYTTMEQIFEKATELTKTGNWKDALSMCIILISSGKITNGKDLKEKVMWDTDEIKAWFHDEVDKAIDPTIQKTVDVKAEIIKEEIIPETALIEPKLGPAVVVGTLDPKEPVVRILKDPSLWKDKYKFKTFRIERNHSRDRFIDFEIIDATPEKEPELLITETNMTAFIDSMRDHLVTKRNEYPWVKDKIFSTLSKFYEIIGAEAKGITGNLVEKADVIRKADKVTKRAEEKAIKDSNDEIEIEKKEVVVSPPADSPKKSVGETANTVPKENPPQDKVTENTVGEPSTNSNDKTVLPVTTNKDSYDGYEDVLKAKTKTDYHIEIYRKICESTNIEDGIKAMFEVINTARKEGRYKNFQVHNWKGVPQADLLGNIKKIVAKGSELAGTKALIS